MNRTGFVVVVFAFVSLTYAGSVAYADGSQDFELWPTTAGWGTTTHTGWTLSDGQVKPSRGGFAPPIDLRCAWLHDFSDSTDSWLESPLYPAGVIAVSVWTRQDVSSGGSSTAKLQTSSNCVEWIDVEEFTITNVDWAERTITVNSFDPIHLRIRKTGDTAANSYAGLDDIQVAFPPPVLLSNLGIFPAEPTREENVDVFVDANIQQSLSGVVLSTFYRHNSSDAFMELPMALDTGITYRTTSPIPPGAGIDGNVQYYVQAAFDLGGLQLVYMPAAGSDAPAVYRPVFVVEPAPRQLSPSSQRTPLIISEIMYHPSDSPNTNSLEYIEIFNTDPVGRDISGFGISGDVDYTFPPGSEIGLRDFIVVARDPDAVEQAYGLSEVFGPFVGSLPNNGGTVRFRNHSDALLLEIDYDDELPWPIAADGAGHSLVLTMPDFGEGTVLSWDASAFVGGSPGAIDPLAEDALRQIVINEYLAHTDLPDVDYIELYNRGTQAVDISECVLSDTLATNKFFVPSGTVLQPGAHVSFDAQELDFSLSSHGDDIYLWAPDRSYVVDAVRFEAQVRSFPNGRFPDGVGSFHVLDAQTLGTANTSAELLINDIVINEIMYAPLSGNLGDEYVELYNKGAQAVDLSDWRLTDGIDYFFPAGTMIPAGGYLVIAEDVQNLLSKYSQLNPLNTLGDYSGRLSDRGERLALMKPDDPNLPFEDLVIVDEVTYSDGDRWGKWADGGGSSLELIDPRSDNRLAMNWLGSDETAKSSWMTIEFTGVLDQGSPPLQFYGNQEFAEELNILIPNAGECLVDDIEVIRSGEGLNRIANSTFDAGLSGWDPDGTHVLTTHEAAEGFSSPGCMHVRSSGNAAIDAEQALTEINHVSAPLTQNGLPGEVFTIRAIVRWLAGWPVCVLGFDDFWLEAASELDVPADLGSPGLQNSRYTGNAGPAMSELEHRPILPQANQAVTVTCHAHDPDGLASLTLEYRVDPSTSYSAVPMLDDGVGGDLLAGDGIYSAQIPGKANGVMTPFRVRAVDSHANPATTYFPSADIIQNALVRFGEPVPSDLFATYIVWMSNVNVADLTSRHSRSDHLVDMTLVYENYRAIYNAGIRFRGNARGYALHSYQRAAYSCSMPKSDRFLGNNEFKLDIPARGWDLFFPGVPSYIVQEHHANWMARKIGMAASHVRFIHARVNGSTHLRHDYQSPTREFSKGWYGDDDPRGYKLTRFQPFGDYRRADGLRAKATYRYGVRSRKTTVPSDSWETLFNVVDAQQTVDDAIYDARMEAMIDPYGFGSYCAVNFVTGNFDSYGWDPASNNLYVYLSSTHRARLHLVDMDLTYHIGSHVSGNVFPFHGAVTYRLYLTRPLFRRAYYRMLKNLVEGPLRPECYEPELQGWYDAFEASGIVAAHPQGMMDWNAYKRGRIVDEYPVDATFEITSNSGSDFSTANSIVTLNGNAPIEVASFRINGRKQRVTYPSDTSWRARLGLAFGPNTLLVEGVGRDGNLVATDTITITLSTAPPSPVDQLVISEIMYHPDEAAAEYIEIYNRSGSTYDLAGWRMNGVDLVFDGGVIIGPGEYRAIAENITAYQHAYGNAEVVIGDYSGNLDNGGETLTLEMPVGSNAWMEVNKVRFDDSGAWSEAADGTGAALQLIDVNADNTRAGNWGVVPAPESARQSPGGANSNATSLFDFPLLWINEVMPLNVSVIADNHGEFEPWIELYNADSATIDLSDYRLSNDYQDLGRWAFPAGTTIAAGSRLLVWADDEASEMDVDFLHADFRLNSASGSVVLARQWLGSPVVIDFLDYNAVGENASIGSYSEGDPFTRTIFQSPTPSSANSITSAPAQIVINEWMSDNETTKVDPADGNYEDWIELYNPSAVDADLNGYTLTDNLADPNMYTLPAGVILPAGEFVLVWADNEPGQNGPGIAPHASFRLSNDGETIGLYAPSGTLVDSVVFGPQGNDQSHGCWPDGEKAIYAMSRPTPAAANSVFAGFMIDMSATSSDVYRVEVNDHLLGTNWGLWDTITTVNGVLIFADTNAVSIPARFYRLSEEL